MRDADYREHISKGILQLKYPAKFSNLVKGESPDWHNDSIGIEVRRAVPSDTALFQHLHKQYSYKYMSSIPMKLLTKLGFSSSPVLSDIDNNIYLQRSDKVGQIMYVYDSAVNDYRVLGIMGPAEDSASSNSSLVTDAIRDKTQKLNNHYSIYPENDVILILDDFADYGLSDDDVSELLKPSVEQIKVEYASLKDELKFDFIYLFFFDLIVEINCEKWEYSSSKITQEDWKLIQSNP